MSNLKMFSTADLIKWFREESAVVLGRLIYFPPLPRYSLNIILSRLHKVHLAIEQRSRTKCPFSKYAVTKQQICQYGVQKRTFINRQ
jgi:hypothetical protein